VSEEYKITPKGWAIASDVYTRYMDTAEPIEEIAKSYGIEPAQLITFMNLVFEVVGD
jgi:hypothetical protein